MALQGSGTSRDVPQTIRMVARTQTQQTAMPSNHLLASYSTIDNAQIQPTVSLAVVPALVQPPQTLASSQGHNVATVAVPAATSTAIGMQPLSHVILRSPKEELGQREQERRIRREIANSNERRRMQSINAGFKSLKSILPHTDGEKLSKAAILQQTSEYITQLESDKLKLMHQNEKLRRAFTDCKCNSSKHRALADIFEKDEGIGSPAEEDFEDVRRGLIEVRQLLDKERRMRIMYEEQVRTLESQLYPERVQSMKLSSSDERRSSSECSQSVTKPTISMPTAKVQTCARPLLPPLAPLFSKGEKSDGNLASDSSSKTVTSTQDLASKSVGELVEIKKESVENKAKVSLVSPSHAEQLVPVFSHSSKSNQPLKKRAIEIHHQSLSDSGNDSGTQPPKRKVAKITIDQPPDIGTRFFLPPTLPPIPTIPSDPSHLMHNIATSLSGNNQKNPDVLSRQEVAQSTESRTIQPPIQLPAHNTKSHNMLLSPTATAQQLSQQVIGQQYLPVHSSINVVSGQKMIVPVASNDNASANMPPLMQVYSSPSAQPQVHAQSEEDCALVARRPSLDVSLDTPAPGLPPVYLTVNGVPSQGANIAYIQHDGNKLIQLAPSYSQPHFIVAPVSKPGTVVVAGTTPDQLLATPSKGARPHQTVFQHGNAGAKVQPAIIAFENTDTSGVSIPTPVVQRSPPQTVETQVAFTQPPGAPTYLQTPTFTKFQPKIQNPQTVLCYTQPEITLNQLNALPNLALPKTLHQPRVLPAPASLLQNTGADSPSYIGQGLHDAGIQTKPGSYVNPSTLRRRQSSLSATDSCSTASASGAEDDESLSKNAPTGDPEGQSRGSVPTVRRSSSSLPAAGCSPSKSPSRSTNVAAYDEVPANDEPVRETAHHPKCLDVADSQTPPPADSTVSVFPSVAGSPPVIRRIDAIQTRRNLETIVQAIDHLEQQERRNSQDRTDFVDEVSN